MRRRHAFTIVELLVAMALIILIMSVLSQSFIAATGSLRDLKALGDMAQRLREAGGTIRRDLAADHFEARKKLSDPSFWDNGPPREGFFRVWYAALTSNSTVKEGVDLDGIPSYRSTGHILHFTVKTRGNLRSDFLSASVPAYETIGGSLTAQALLQPSMGLLDRRYEDPLPPPPGAGATIPNVNYNYQWAEVEYFLRAVTDQTGKHDNANGVPLFALFRRQHLAVPDNSLVTPAIPFTSAANYLEVSNTPGGDAAGNVRFNSPLDLTMPARRHGTTLATTSITNARAGLLEYRDPITNRRTYRTKSEENPTRYSATDDLLLTDVLSFDVRVLLAGGTDFVSLDDDSVQVFNNNNSAYYIKPARLGAPLVFDTWSNATDDVFDYNAVTASGKPIWQTPGTFRSVPLYQNPTTGQKIRILAIQITLRVWDFKTKQARQITIVQDL